MNCERCGRPATAVTCSRFNTEMVCPPCEALERAHPDYDRARDAELEAVRSGDLNYPGIGLPAGLREASRERTMH